MKHPKHLIPRRPATLPRPMHIGLPPLARQYLTQWRAAHPDEPWQPETIHEVFIRSGAGERVSTLLSLLLILTLVLDTIVTEINDILSGFSMWRTGFKQAVNSTLTALRRLTSTMQSFIVQGMGGDEEQRARQRQIALDYDVLIARIFRFAAIPVNWKLGEPTGLPQPQVPKKSRAGRLRVNLPYGNCCIIAPELAVPDDSARLITRYAVYHYAQDRGRAELRSNLVPTLRGARRIAARLHRRLPTETFLIYRIEHPTRPATSLFPIDYINNQKQKTDKSNKPNKTNKTNNPNQNRQ